MIENPNNPVNKNPVDVIQPTVKVFVPEQIIEPKDETTEKTEITEITTVPTVPTVPEISEIEIEQTTIRKVIF